jgi:hypothetical protein
MKVASSARPSTFYGSGRPADYNGSRANIPARCYCLNNMMPFDSYPSEGKALLGRVSGNNCRRGYGLKFMRVTGQTTCAYCGLDLVASFENWLQMALDHVVPRNVCKSISLPDEWTKDCINRVLACSACNGLDNRYKPQVLPDCPRLLTAFCELRDLIFAERKKRIATCRDKERDFFQRRLWEHPLAGDRLTI